MKIMNIDVEEFYIKTSPFYWSVWILVAVLKVIAFLISPFRNGWQHFFIVRKYSDEQCANALKNLNNSYKNRNEMPYYYKWAFDYCTKRLKTK